MLNISSSITNKFCFIFFHPRVQFWIPPLIIFSLSFLVRFLVLSYGDYHNLGGDESYYWRAANGFLAGKYNNRFFMPGWPWVLSWARYFSPDLFWGRTLTIFIASLTSIFVFRIGCRVFNQKTGLWAGLIFALYPEHIFYSHYLYAEILVEFFVVVGTFLAFKNGVLPRRGALLAIAFFWMGLGLLVKHFLVVSLFSLVLALYFIGQFPIKKVLILGLFFLIAPLTYSAHLMSKGKDWMMIINSPVKSSREWEKARWRSAGFRTEEQRKNVIRGLLGGYLERPLSATFHSFKTNLYRLWSPGTYVLRRLIKGNYRAIPWKWGTANLCAGAFMGLLILGSLGLWVAPFNIFKGYALLNILLVSSLSIMFFMMSRYRIPFFFIFILYSAYFLTHFQWLKQRIANFRLINWTIILGVVAGMAHLLWDRIPNITQYQ